ncbi:MAG: TatD family hydrolase [Candidatus Pacebacteria bacterium]|nr:TatD family hydrolase [Candidatus Paceibacterota bacterium]
MKYFDAHCHIQFSAYDEDRASVLARMRDAEVGGLIVGVDKATSEAAVELVESEAAEGHGDLIAAIGLHPNDTEEPFDAAAFDEMARGPKVRAIGECGLDYYRPDEPETVKLKQREVFEHQIELAVKYDKPLMIHSRPSKGSQDAYHDTIDLLTSKKREYGDRLKGDMHFFVGGVEEARAFANLDFTMSYTAVITFARDYDEVIRFLPLENLLTETDSPYVAPAPNRGKRNEPTAVRNVVRAMAQIRGEDEEKVRMAVLQNAAQIFSFSL